MRIAGAGIIIIIVSIILIAFIASLGYIFYFNRKAQRSLDDYKTKRTNLPTPLVFIVTTLLIASLIGNVISIFGFASSKNEERFYSQTSIGELASEYHYIKDEVIKGLKAEYDITSKESNDFVIYYAKIKDVIKDTTNFLPHYLIYIEYIGSEVLDDNYQMKLTRGSGLAKSSVYSKFKSSYSILLLSSHEFVNLEISAEIKQFEIPQIKDDFDIGALFEESGEVLYSFRFKMVDSEFK